MHHLPGQSSGGQRQRVAVARALANQPPLALADEPAGSLDAHAGQDLMNLPNELYQSRGVTFVIVTHDPAVARQTRRGVAMTDGQIVREDRIGSPLEEDLKTWRHSDLPLTFPGARGGRSGWRVGRRYPGQARLSPVGWRARSPAQARPGQWRGPRRRRAGRRGPVQLSCLGHLGHGVAGISNRAPMAYPTSALSVPMMAISSPLFPGCPTMMRAL